VPFEGFDSEGEALAHEDEGPGRPYGVRPYGVRPYGVRPYGVRPYGVRPYGVRPYGVRPYGVRPYGVRPYGVRPYGVRPYGVREGQTADSPLDAREWGADLAELVCERSAAIRLGATVVAIEDQLWIPQHGPGAGFRPVPAPPALGPPEELEPCDNTIEALVAVPSALYSHAVAGAELASALKDDLGEAIVQNVDAATLLTLPRSIGSRAAIQEPTVAGDLVATLRAVLLRVLGHASRPAFRSPGWILHPLTLVDSATLRTLDGATVSTAVNARPLADYDLLRLDSGHDGMLFGAPFVTSGDAVDATGSPTIFFGADWEEAWIGVDPELVTVDRPAAPAVAGARVIRASMSLDFTLRREPAFAWAVAP
jgi:Phage capsid family